jgi:electron transport complex protein RnfB
MNEITISILVLGTLGLGFALLLAWLSKKLKVEEDPRMVKIMEILPGLNCGACGFSGCRAYAEAVIKKCSTFSGCLPGGSELNQKISHLLGISGCFSNEKAVAVCRCGAEEGEKKVSFIYQGPLTCKAANLTGGAIDCSYGCLALGDCVKVCPVKVISIKNKKVYIDTKNCIGCGQCVKACPRKLFNLVPLKESKDIYYVACNNKDKVLAVKQVCTRGCIGCGICARVENSPYYIRDNLSNVDYKNANQNEPLEQGKTKCPTKCIDIVTVTVTGE